MNNLDKIKSIIKLYDNRCADALKRKETAEKESGRQKSIAWNIQMNELIPLESELIHLHELLIIVSGIEPDTLKRRDDILTMISNRKKTDSKKKSEKLSSQIEESKILLRQNCEHKFIAWSKYYYDNEPYCERSYNGYRTCLVCHLQEEMQENTRENDVYKIMVDDGSRLISTSIKHPNTYDPFIENSIELFVTKHLRKLYKDICGTDLSL